jgi:branched-chain amino acid transport system ATP-binding protein
MSALVLTNVVKNFGAAQIIRDVPLEIPEGERHAIIGPNGAGKSTLFNIIAGAFPPSEGRIIFEGQDITRLSAPKRCQLGIGRTFQVPKSFDTMTVIENVIVGGFVRNASASAARRAALETLEFAALTGRAESPAGELTPPEKRRLEVARALATGPKLLLLDEVFAGLTPSEARLGSDLVKRVRDHGVTVVMVEHVMEIVMPLVDRAIVLDLGRVLSQGTPSQVVADPKVITAYLGERHRAA